MEGGSISQTISGKSTGHDQKVHQDHMRPSHVCLRVRVGLGLSLGMRVRVRVMDEGYS